MIKSKDEPQIIQPTTPIKYINNELNITTKCISSTPSNPKSSEPENDDELITPLDKLLNDAEMLCLDDGYSEDKDKMTVTYKFAKLGQKLSIFLISYHYQQYSYNHIHKNHFFILFHVGHQM